MSAACGGSSHRRCEGEYGLIADVIVGKPTFKTGEPVDMKLDITNCVGEPVTITYPDDERYSFGVFECDVDVCSQLWYSRDPDEEPGPPGKQTWREGQTISYEMSWNQEAYFGQVPPREYVAEGRNPACHTGVQFHCDTSVFADFSIMD